MKYFKIFTNCKFIEGSKRVLIYDLQRQTLELVPKSIMIIVNQLNQKKPVDDVITQYSLKEQKIVKEYIKFLEDKEYGIYCSYEEYDKFIEMDNTFHNPYLISNFIIELKKEKIKTLKNLILPIISMGCKNLSIVFYESLSLKNFIEISSYLKNTKINSVEITFKYSSKINDDFFIKINKIIRRLIRLTIFKSPINKIKLYDNDILFDRIYTINNITSFISCGNVNKKYFDINLSKVLESINHNSCLNKKMSIDINGNIKNCPSMPQSFGNIKDTTLEEALNHKDFKKYWNITKDLINVCKDCEFRHVCTDCRAYIENPKDIYSKPLKCGYNPYTNEWSEWSTNPLKQKAIEYYGMQELVKKDNDL